MKDEDLQDYILDYENSLNLIDDSEDDEGEELKDESNDDEVIFITTIFESLIKYTKHEGVFLLDELTLGSTIDFVREIIN